MGTYRIIQGDSIVSYIMVGYIVVIILTYIAPRTIIPIAYDSGGVTTSTVTVPIVAAFGLGLAEVIPGRDPLIDGFGFIAFASLFPMIAVLAYGISKREAIRFHERRILQLEQMATKNLFQHLDSGNEGDDTGARVYINSLKISKKKIITLTGEAGSGVSTVTKILANALEYRSFSAGGLFRNIARQRHLTVESLNDYARDNTIIDQEIDGLIRRLGEGSEIVLDARLGYCWIHDSFRVFLKVSPANAAQRVFEEIKCGKRFEEGATSLDQTMIAIEKQFESTQKRYFRDYGIDITNVKPFDLVVDTDNKTAEEVAKTILKCYRAWLEAS